MCLGRSPCKSVCKSLSYELLLFSSWVSRDLKLLLVLNNISLLNLLRKSAILYVSFPINFGKVFVKVSFSFYLDTWHLVRRFTPFLFHLYLKPSFLSFSTKLMLDSLSSLWLLEFSFILLADDDVNQGTNYQASTDCMKRYAHNNLSKSIFDLNKRRFNHWQSRFIMCVTCSPVTFKPVYGSIQNSAVTHHSMGVPPHR